MTWSLRLMDEQRVAWFDLRRFLPGPWQIEDELQDSEWEREPEPESAIGTVYEAAPRAIWTDKAPTQPGVYQCRAPGESSWKVAEVYRERLSGQLAMRWTDFGPFRFPQPGLEWANREILTPQEPT